MVLVDGDISQTSLRFASSFGRMLYVRNNNNETNKEMHVTNDPANWEDEMYKDIDEFKNMDPNFRICIISQSSKQCMSLNDNIMKKDPELKIKMLTGTHSGITKTVYFEDIKNTLEPCDVFIFSPVIESGVDITIPMKKIYGVMSAQSNSQRAFLQMIARRRKVEEPVITLYTMTGSYRYMTTTTSGHTQMCIKH